MTNRDTFAAAQRTCLRIDRWLEGDLSDDADQTLRDARCLLITLAAKLEYADAMLRERERVTEPMPKEKRAEVSSALVFSGKTGSWPVSYEKSDEKRVLYDTNHDAAPAAIASPSESSVPLGGGCGGTDKPVTLPAVGTGNTTLDGAPAAEAGAGKPQISHPQAGNTQTAPPCVETDGPPSKGEGLHVPYSRTRDIVTRLRGWFKDVNAVPATDLMDEAADEIERLRIRSHEREAIAAAAESVKLDDDSNWTTLIELLERTK